MRQQLKVKSVTDALEFMGRQVEDVKQKWKWKQSRVVILEKENNVLCDRCNDLDASRRRWSLKVSPHQLDYSVDIAHRPGPSLSSCHEPTGTNSNISHTEGQEDQTL